MYPEGWRYLVAGTTISSSQIEQCIQTIQNWDGNRVTDEFRQAVQTLAPRLNNQQVIQALEQGQSQTRSASAGSDGMGYRGADST